MGGLVAGHGLYKAGHAGSCSKHFTHSHRKKEELCTPGAPKPNSQTLTNGHLSESEMATFVSVSFPSHQHSGPSTARLRLADLCGGGLFRPVLTLCNSGRLVPLMGFQLLKAGRNVEGESSIDTK